MNRLKERLGNGQPQFGVWSQLGSPNVVEAISCLQVDWILLDCEHGAPAYDTLVPLLQAMQTSETSSIVRIPSCDPVAIARVCDMGVEGILLPRVETTEQVAEAVAATRYPPGGTRGIGPWRASRFGTDPSLFQDPFPVAVIAQVETLGALDNLDSILAIVGLDGVLVGPADLSAALGHFLDMQHEEVKQADARIAAAAKKAGKVAGYYCNTGAQARERIDQGFNMVNVTSDVGSLMHGVRSQLKAARG
jgi:2-dehydro-3-deoxyglucarate aldolase